MIEEIRDAFFSSLTIRSASDENIESCPSSVTMLQKPDIVPSRINSNTSSGSQSPVSSPSKMILKSMLKPSASCETLAEVSDVCDFIPILVSIEGNIGAGKSTLLKALKKSQLDWCFIDEPLDTWTSLINDEGVNLLELFYGDLRRWAYTFQNCAVLSRYQNIEKSIAKVRSTTEDAIRAAASSNKDGEKGGRQLEKVFKVFITERCLDTDYQVFAKMMKADGQFDSLEFDLYYRWYQLLSSSSTSLSAIVYVDTEPETCSDRIKCRNREGEEGIPVSYLKSLHQFQSNWINNSSVPWTKVCSTELDASVNFINNIVKDIASKY
jgi:deoxyadenosine/deoxycytidine kinase